VVVEEVVAAAAEAGAVVAAAVDTKVEVGEVEWDWDYTVGSSTLDPPSPTVVGEDTSVAVVGEGLVNAAPVAKPNTRPLPWNPA